MESKEELSKKLNDDMARFIAGGGKPYRCSNGETGVPEMQTREQFSQRLYNRSKVMVKPAKAFEDLTGKVYGQVTVLSFNRKDSNGHIYWNTQCSCGDISISDGQKLRSGAKTKCKKCAYKVVGEKLRAANKDGRHYKHSPEKVHAFWQLLYDGYKYEVIAQKIDVAIDTLRTWRSFRSFRSLNIRVAKEYGFEVPNETKGA